MVPLLLSGIQSLGTLLRIPLLTSAVPGLAGQFNYELMIMPHRRGFFVTVTSYDRIFMLDKKLSTLHAIIN